MYSTPWGRMCGLRSGQSDHEGVWLAAIHMTTFLSVQYGVSLSYCTPEEMDQLWSKYRTPTTRTG